MHAAARERERETALNGLVRSLNSRVSRCANERRCTAEYRVSVRAASEQGCHRELRLAYTPNATAFFSIHTYILLLLMSRRRAIAGDIYSSSTFRLYIWADVR